MTFIQDLKLHERAPELPKGWVEMEPEEGQPSNVYIDPILVESGFTPSVTGHTDEFYEVQMNLDNEPPTQEHKTHGYYKKFNRKRTKNETRYKKNYCRSISKSKNTP